MAEHQPFLLRAKVVISRYGVSGITSGLAAALYALDLVFG